MEELVKGALDLHVHPGPDVQARKIDDLALSPRYAQAGMAGYAIKSHYLCTAERAKLVRVYLKTQTSYKNCTKSKNAVE